MNQEVYCVFREEYEGDQLVLVFGDRSLADEAAAVLTTAPFSAYTYTVSPYAVETAVPRQFTYYEREGFVTVDGRVTRERNQEVTAWDHERTPKPLMWAHTANWTVYVAGTDRAQVDAIYAKKITRAAARNTQYTPPREKH